MPEPSPLFSAGSTKYFTPLFVPTEILKSTESSKFEKLAVVMMSPPTPLPAIPEGGTLQTPSRISHPRVGNASLAMPRHPRVVFPSHNRLQPCSRSATVRVFGGASAADAGPDNAPAAKTRANKQGSFMSLVARTAEAASGGHKVAE